MVQGMKLVLIGAVIGIPASLAAVRLLSSMFGWIDDKRCAHHWSRYSATGGSNSARMLFTRATRNESRSIGDAQVRVGYKQTVRLSVPAVACAPGITGDAEQAIRR